MSESPFVRELRDATKAAVDKIKSGFDGTFEKNREKLIFDIVKTCKINATQGFSYALIRLPRWNDEPRPGCRDVKIAEHILCILRNDSRLQGLDIKDVTELGSKNQALYFKW